MANLIVIPARMGATRFPGKPLAMIAGKTLIQRVCERAATLPGLAELRVATDDRRIREHVESLGFDVRVTSPDHPSGSDRVAEAAADWSGPVLNLQGDEPLFDREAVAGLLVEFEERPELLMGTVGVPLAPGDLENPDRVKLLRGEDGLAVDFTREADCPIPSGGERLLHAGVYLYRAETLRRFVALPPSRREKEQRLEQLRAMDAGIPIWVQRGDSWAPGVDRPEDLKVIANRISEP